MHRKIASGRWGIASTVCLSRKDSVGHVLCSVGNDGLEL
jgi:hypothetical protein